MNDAADYMERLAKAGTRSRANVIQEICEDLKIPKQACTFAASEPYHHLMTNVYLLGEGNLWLMAHHDVIVPGSHNANDNTASVVNAILCKKCLPWLNVAFTDGEESPNLGTGSRAFAYIYPQAHVINLELTGIGGSRCMAVERRQMPLTQFFASKIPCLDAPFSDAHVLEGRGIDCACVFTCTNGVDFVPELLRRSHTMDDSLENISLTDMEDFREKLIEMLTEMKGENCGVDFSGQAPRTI
jgi:hypothetical protein